MKTISFIITIAVESEETMREVQVAVKRTLVSAGWRIVGVSPSLSEKDEWGLPKEDDFA